MPDESDLDQTHEIAHLSEMLAARLRHLSGFHHEVLAKAPAQTSVQAEIPVKHSQAPNEATSHLSISSLMALDVPVMDRLEKLRNEVIGDCKRCKLCATRKNIVFGVGDPKAKLVFVGEGPGAREDEQGEPFVGRAGQLLTKMIEAMGYQRSDVYICNVVKCRPPENRDPEPDEVESCEPFLKAQLAMIQPQAIVALGRVACQTLLKTKTPMGLLRGKWTQYEGVDLMPTFHPAFLLRNPPKKAEAWEDLQQVMKRLKA